MTKHYGALGLLALVLTLTGCGPATGHASGTVTLAGNPVGPGQIHFLPEPTNQSARDAVGNLDEQGRYQLKIAGGSRDIPVGEYRVAILMGALDESPANAPAIPAKYEDAATSNLRATIKSGENECNFTLENEPLKK